MTYWVLLIMNFLASFLVGIMLIIFRTQTVFYGLSPDKWMSIGYNTALEVIGCLQVLSGYFLV